MDDRTLAAIEAAIADTLAGNPEAYTLIVTTYMQKLHRLALYLCRYESEAEDLVQETLIEGFLHLGNLREPAKIEAWLGQILKYKALRVVRRRERTEFVDVAPDRPDRVTPATAHADAETLSEWRRRLESLTPALRETAMLYFWHDLPMEEIAYRTETPLGTVKSRIHSAREVLRKELHMSEQKNTLPDGFAEAVEKKITELQNYHKLYGTTAGFDAAYRSVKELIDNLSDKETMKKYAIRSAEIAAETDAGTYGEDALATYRKWGDAQSAMYLYFTLGIDRRGHAEGAKYLAEVALPDLMTYPEGPDRDVAMGYIHLWKGRCYLEEDLTDREGRFEADVREAIRYYERAGRVDAMYTNALAGLRVVPYLRRGEDMAYVTVTGEHWRLYEDGNVYYRGQPGFSAGGSLYRYERAIFYYAGCSGDRWFFPQGMKLEAGATESMTDRGGNLAGTREVVSLTETVYTPAGTFEDCILIRKTETDGTVYEMWYKDGVGLVKERNPADPALCHKVLTAYEIKGGEGLLPVAVGNRWCYESPAKPDCMTEVNEYVMEQSALGTDDEGRACISVTLSCLNYMGMQEDWRENVLASGLLLDFVSALCDEKKYADAVDVLRRVIIANTDRETVDDALSLLGYLDEKSIYDKQTWRFCPSSANISALTLQSAHGRIRYGESCHISCDTGVWGSRGEENRIFGVKPFRYLQILTGTLWDDRWVAGYEADVAHEWRDDEATHIKVENSGRIETPAGVFENTLHLRLTCGDIDAPKDTDYFFNNTDCGEKDYWFAPGVGVVRFDCHWGKHLSSSCVLTDYRVIAREGEMMPVHIGNRWRYEEVNLTAEDYIARRDYHVLSGMGGNFRLGDHQMFTFKGTIEDYEAYKKRLVTP